MLKKSIMIVFGPVALAAVLASAAAFAAPAGDGEQKIYLDPQTGDVVADPARQKSRAGEARQRKTAPEAKAQSKTERRPKAWTNDEGADMVTPDPNAAPMLKAVRCPDGTLRIGHADMAGNDNGREALCARNTH